MNKKTKASANDNLSSMDLKEEFDFNLDNISELVERYRYQGFDPLKIRKRIIEMENNKAQLIEDLKVLAVLFITRGTKKEKLLMKTSADYKTDISRIFSKYKISDTLVNADAITLTRISSAFPILFCRTLLDIGDSRFTGLGFSHSIYNISTYAACIPRDKDGVLEDFIKRQTEIQEKISGMMGISVNKDAIRQSILSAFNSNFVLENDRKTFDNLLNSYNSG